MPKNSCTSQQGSSDGSRQSQTMVSNRQNDQHSITNSQYIALESQTKPEMEQSSQSNRPPDSPLTKSNLREHEKERNTGFRALSFVPSGRQRPYGSGRKPPYNPAYANPNNIPIRSPRSGAQSYPPSQGSVGAIIKSIEGGEKVPTVKCPKAGGILNDTIRTPMQQVDTVMRDKQRMPAPKMKVRLAPYAEDPLVLHQSQMDIEGLKKEFQRGGNNRQYTWVIGGKKMTLLRTQWIEFGAKQIKH